MTDLRPDDDLLESFVTRDRDAGAGARVWYFPDGDTPPPARLGAQRGHEALLILNVAATPAQVRLDLFWVDRAPTLGIALVVEPERVVCRYPPFGELAGQPDLAIPVRTQYALRVRSDVPIVCQLGRIEVEPAFGMYTTMGWSA